MDAMTNGSGQQPEPWNERTLRLIGVDGVGRLEKSSVLIVGLGGVGGYAAEMLLRAGVGHLTLLDGDTVAPSNLNRQIIATTKNIGSPKAIMFAERFHEINPEARIDCLQTYLEPENVKDLLDEKFDFVVDCIDTIAPKVELLAQCADRGIKVISSMGTGGRMDPARIEYRDIWETCNDGLARAVRQRLKKRGMKARIPVVASTEIPMGHSLIELESENKRSSYGTLCTIPAIFGIMMANYVILELIGK